MIDKVKQELLKEANRLYWLKDLKKIKGNCCIERQKNIDRAFNLKFSTMTNEELKEYINKWK